MLAVTMAAVVTMVMAALFTPVAVMRCWRLPCHYSRLVVGDRLHHPVLRPGLVIGHRWSRIVLWLWLVVGRRLRVMRSHRIRAGRITRTMVLAGDAGTHQTAGTGTHNCTIAAAHMVADGSTGHSANTSTYKSVEIVRIGLRCQHRQATRHQGEACQLADCCSRWREKRRRKGQNTWCVHGVKRARARTAKRSGLSSFNVPEPLPMTA